MGKTQISLAAALGALALSGCHSNLYSTPRTVPVGKTQHIVAVDGHSMTKTSYFVPPAMVYIARRGLSDRVDLGFQVSSTLKLDLKINAVRTDYFDLAFDPSISAGVFAVGSFGSPFLTMALPVIMGLNLGERVTLVAQTGPGSTIPFSGFKVYPFFGAGLQIRVTDLVTIQPEFTSHFMSSDSSSTCFGIGVGFGPQPHYGRTRDSKPRGTR